MWCDDYLLYRTSKGEWWLSPAQTKQPILLEASPGGPNAVPAGSVSFSPGAAFLAIFSEGKVTVFRNPFK
ncbi:MAG: hypothetical protein Q8P50_13515 [Bacillota bacterium]|nr:hypothetical protein [Bacillota bacterium]